MKNQMTNNEAIEMMHRASSEIKMLRQQIDIREPKAHAYDNLTAIINLLPKQTQGYGEDVAYMLDKRIKELKDTNTSEPKSSLT